MTMRRLMTGVVALGAATVFAQVVGFAVIVVMARRLGAESLGSFSFATSLAGYFAIPATFGVTSLAIREMAREPDRAQETMGEVILLQAVLCVVPYLAAVLLASALTVDDTSRVVLPIVALSFVIDVGSLQWVLYASHRFWLLAVARMAGTALFGVLALTLVRSGGQGARDLAWVSMAGLLPATAMTAFAALRVTGRPAFTRSPRHLLRRFTAGVPLGVTAVMISIYYTIDSLMLGYLKDAETVGIYAVAYKIPLAVIGFAALWSSVFFPHASALAGQDRVELRKQLDAFASMCIVLSLPILMGALLLGGDLMPELFGDAFAAASTPFVILTAAAALVVVTINYGTVAVAIGDERHVAIGTALAAGSNLVANFVVIPLFGMTGAASATLVAEIVVFAYVFARLRKSLGPLGFDTERLARAGVATALMAVAIVVVGGGPSAVVRAGLGVAVFTVAAAALRVLRPHEIRTLMGREGKPDAVRPVATLP